MMIPLTAPKTKPEDLPKKNFGSSPLISTESSITKQTVFTKPFFKEMKSLPRSSPLTTDLLGYTTAITKMSSPLRNTKRNTRVSSTLKDLTHTPVLRHIETSKSVGANPKIPGCTQTTVLSTLKK